jgi:bifunctional DNase/RNase
LALRKSLNANDLIFQTVEDGSSADARPSDCIAMATQQTAPIYVSLDVWNEVEDMTEALRKMQQEGSYTEESDEEEES